MLIVLVCDLRQHFLNTVSIQAKQMLREADTNGDGRISRDEFNDLLKV